MSWYDIENVNCIFALDYNSEIDEINSKIKFTNDNTRVLTAHNPELNSVKKEIIKSYEIINYSYSEPTNISEYKTLRLNKKMFNFDVPVELTNEFTLIIKCRVNTPSLILSATGEGLNHGPAFEATPLSSDSIYWYSWRIHSYQSGQDYPYESRLKGSSGTIVTMILKGNLGLKNVQMITNYGTYTIPTNSNSFNYFLKPQLLEVLGYVYSDLTWLPNINIVAYGLFDKELSETQVSTLLDTVDSDFLISKKDLNLKSNKKELLNFYKFYKPQKLENTFRTEIFESEHIIEDTSIKKYTSIKDYVFEENTPVITTLFLLERQTGRLVAKTTSNSNGYFEFININIDLEYIVVTPDKKYQYKSILKDYDKRE